MFTIKEAEFSKYEIATEAATSTGANIQKRRVHVSNQQGCSLKTGKRQKYNNDNQLCCFLLIWSISITLSNAVPFFFSC